jgi:hypothetical protein
MLRTVPASWSYGESMKDFLEQLADLEVRQPPPEFDRQLHDRLNRALLVQHIADLILGGVPWALSHFVRSVGGWFRLTFTGKLNERERK